MTVLAAAPAEADSYHACESIARGHYENFPVLSRTLPKHLRPHVAAVYAFARAADDDADEMDARTGAARLAEKRDRLVARRFEGDPVFEALGQTIRKFDLPIEPFLDLVNAFQQDTVKPRYENFDEVLDYCRRSADPVGRIVLMLFGFRDAERFRLSDRICTSLQLINFWQDVRSDYLDRNRIYIPAVDLAKFGVTENELAKAGTPGCPDRLRALIDFQIARTWPMMREGWKLVALLPPRLKLPIAMFAAGGSTVLRQIRANRPRPTLNGWKSKVTLPMYFFRILFS